MSFSTTELVDALGAYHREKSGEVIQELVYDPFGTARDASYPLVVWDGRIMRRRFFKDQQSFASTAFDIQARPAGANVVEQTDPAISIAGAIRQIRDAESIFSLNPYVLQNTYLDEVMQARRKFREQPQLEELEFVPWLVEHMLKHWVRNICRYSVFHGEYDATGTYAPLGTAGESYLALIDGFLKQITDAIAANKIPASHVIETGAISASNAYDKFELMAQGLPSHMEYEDCFLLCSRQHADWYNMDHFTQFGANPAVNDMYKRPYLRNRENVTIVPVPDMKDSERVIITTAQNLSFNHDMSNRLSTSSDLFGPQLVFHPKNVKEIQVMIRHGFGVSVDDWRNVVVNDQPVVEEDNE
jgi:hypothetical protein